MRNRRCLASLSVALAFASVASAQDPCLSLEERFHDTGGFWFLPTRPVVADFTRDGVPDVVVTAYDLFPEPGILTFVPGLRSPSGFPDWGPLANQSIDVRPAWTFAGDYDGDGALDVASLHARTTGSSGTVDPARLQLHLGDGTGAFAPPLLVRADGFHSVVQGDVNVDGVLDFVLSDWDEEEFVTLLGDGQGGFREVRSPATCPTTRISGETLALMDGDAFPDLVGDCLDFLVVYRGNGDGTFSPASQTRIERGGGASVADFDGDGRLDVASLDVFDDRIELFFGDGDGGIREVRSFAPSLFSLKDTRASDLNLDGVVDLVLVDDATSPFVLLGDGSGGFGPPVKLPSTNHRNHRTSRIEVVDFLGDGRPDLATIEANDFVHYRNTCDAGLVPPRFVAPTPDEVVIATPGVPLRFGVRLLDDAGIAHRTIGVTVEGLPSGALHTPALPARLSATGGAQVTFTWTPTILDVGKHALRYVATAGRDVRATRSVTVRVSACVQDPATWAADPDRWPVASLLLGGRAFTQAQLLALLGLPTQSGPGSPVRVDRARLVALVQATIAARLNEAAGVVLPAEVAEALARADEIFASLGYPDGMGATNPRLLNELIKLLERFHAGELPGGPARCG